MFLEHKFSQENYFAYTVAKDNKTTQDMNLHVLCAPTEERKYHEIDTA